MQRIGEILSIYLTGLFQGLVLVSLPAASSIFTDPHGFGFSQAQYGALFIPQVIMCILAALISPQLSKIFGSKRIFQFGLILNILAAAFMSSSQLFINQPKWALPIMLLSTSCVGLGFGTTLPIINVFAQHLFPKNSSGALTALHTLLGAGTAVAPVLILMLVKGLGWWVVPVASLIVLFVILIFSFVLPLASKEQQGSASAGSSNRSLGGVDFYLFITIVFLYGFCETMFSNWSIIYLNKEQGIGLTQASLSLSIFWAMVTLGRLIVTMLVFWVKPIVIYGVLPLMMMGTFVCIKSIHSPWGAFLIFGFAGLSCSAFFPLTFSQAQARFEAIAERMGGILMAFYMFGYGVASYGVGKLAEDGHWLLGDVYSQSMYVALVLAVLVFLLAQKIQKPIT